MSQHNNQPGPKQVDLKKLKPYGDIMDDGTIQLCFTLPVEPSPEAREAAISICSKMGLDQVKVATMEKAANGFAMFVIYANVKATVDFTKIHVVKVESKKRSREEIDEIIKEKIGRKLVVLGACTGFDAHTVGIDAIMNMKGFAGDYGLERYQWLDARNLGAQVLNDELLKLAIREKADVILVSKVVTQHNIHIKDLKDMTKRAAELGVRDQMVFVAGGPRVTHPMALECGFDAGFGVGTKPSDVASYIVDEYLKRMGAVEAAAPSAVPPKSTSRPKRNSSRPGLGTGSRETTRRPSSRKAKSKKSSKVVARKARRK